MRTDASAPPSLAGALEMLHARGLTVRRASDAPMPDRARPSVSSGHPALDAALGTGGWPRGALAFLDAPPGSGATTLALGTLAATQAAGGLAAWVDGDGTLDPAVAAHLGVDLEWLLLARPRDAAEAVDLTAWLVRSALIDALVLDLGSHGAADRGMLDRVGALLVRSGATAALLLAPAARGTAAAVSGVRVTLRRGAWLAAGRDLVGQRVHATVERHRWGVAGRSADLDLWFMEGRRIERLLPAAARPRPVDVAATERRPLRVVGA